MLKRTISWNRRHRRTSRVPVGRVVLPILICSSTFCVGCDSPAGPGPDSSLSEVSVEPDGGSVNGLGATFQFSARGSDQDGRPVPSPSVTWTSLSPGVATVDPGTGEAFAVASGQATIVAEGNGANGHAVITVSVPGSGPIQEWVFDNGPSATPPLNARQASSEIDVVGNGAGSELHLYGLWGSPSEGVVAVGEDGLVWTLEGGWEEVWSADLRGLWGTSLSEMYSVGNRGLVLHSDGTDWSWMTGGESGTLRGVWGSAPNSVFAVGNPGEEPLDGLILHYDGNSWSEFPRVEDRLADVWGVSATNVIAVGRRGGRFHVDGDIWTKAPWITGEDLSAVWGTSASNVYAVGEVGTILHYDGAGWTGENVPPGRARELLEGEGVAHGPIASWSPIRNV